MSVRAQELRKKRKACVEAARSIMTQAEKRPTDQQRLNSDEERQWDLHMAEVDQLEKEIEREEKVSTLETDLQRSQADPPHTGTRQGQEQGPRGPQSIEERAFRKYLQSGRLRLTGEEMRALQADSDTAGGFLLMPRQQSNTLIKSLDDLVFVRRRATVEIVTGAQSLGAPSLDADPEDGDWTTEVKAVDFDDSMVFGDRELTPHPCTKGLKVSNKLMRLAKNPEGLVQDRLRYKMSITQERAYLTGNGAGKPLGVFTASTQGISTSRDVSTGNAATSIGSDGLIEAKYALKMPYWKKAAWCFHRDAAKQIRKLKDGDGQYLWEPSIQAGQPDQLLELPLEISEYAPNTFTASQYVGIVGDWSYYWIADSEEIMIQRLDELYAETRQTGFIAEFHSDGMPVLEEAFSRVKLGA